MTDVCCWCGHIHPSEALCTQRPKWSRRGFLALCGVGVAGAMLPALPSVDTSEHALTETFIDFGETYKVFQVRLTYDSVTGTRVYDAVREAGQKSWIQIAQREIPAGVRATGMDVKRVSGGAPDFLRVTEWTEVPLKNPIKNT